MGHIIPVAGASLMCAGPLVFLLAFASSHTSRFLAQLCAKKTGRRVPSRSTIIVVVIIVVAAWPDKKTSSSERSADSRVVECAKRVACIWAPRRENFACQLLLPNISFIEQQA